MLTLILQDALREAGCISKLSEILEARTRSMEESVTAANAPIVIGIANCINNLSFNEVNQDHLKVSFKHLHRTGKQSKRQTDIFFKYLSSLLMLFTLFRLPHEGMII